jgi:hypothetical protein
MVRLLVREAERGVKRLTDPTNYTCSIVRQIRMIFADQREGAAEELTPRGTI